jgi:hypothetical protein
VVIAKVGVAIATGNDYHPSIVIYLKSLLAGLGAPIAVVLLGILGFIGWGWRRSIIVAFNISSPWIIQPVLIVAGFIFVVGFSWEFRRLTRTNPR